MGSTNAAAPAVTAHDKHGTETSASSTPERSSPTVSPGGPSTPQPSRITKVQEQQAAPGLPNSGHAAQAPAAFTIRRGFGRTSDSQDPSKPLPLARGRAERPCKARRCLSRLPLPGHKRLHNRLEAPDLPRGRLMLATSCPCLTHWQAPKCMSPQGMLPRVGCQLWYVESPAGSHTAQLCNLHTGTNTTAWCALTMRAQSCF